MQLGHANVAQRVLGTCDLVSIICSFQYGLHDDLRPFKALRSKNHPTFGHYTRLERVFGPWYRHYGVHRVDRWLACLKPTYHHFMVLHAIVYGLDEVLAMVYARCGAAVFDVDEELLDVAAWSGHLKCVQFLHAHLKPHGGGCTAFAIDLAAAKGHLEIVRFLHENRSEGCTVEAMDLAAKFGHFTIVQFLHTHRSEGCTTDAMDFAAWRGHLEIVQFLHSNRREGCTGRALVKAAANGKADVVRFLLEHRDEGCIRRALAAYPKPFMRNILVDRLKSDGCPCHACAGRDGCMPMAFGMISSLGSGVFVRAVDWPIERHGISSQAILSSLQQENRTNQASTSFKNSRGKGQSK